MKTALKLLISSYLIILLPYISTTLTVEYIINNGFIENSEGVNSLVNAVGLFAVIFIVEQLSAVAIIKILFFKDKQVYVERYEEELEEY